MTPKPQKIAYSSICWSFQLDSSQAAHPDLMQIHHLLFWVFLFFLLEILQFKDFFEKRAKLLLLIYFLEEGETWLFIT